MVQLENFHECCLDMSVLIIVVIILVPFSYEKLLKKHWLWAMHVIHDSKLMSHIILYLAVTHDT